MNTEKTGKLIAEKRKEKDLTQKQLAELLYVSDKEVSRWETGRGFPEITILEDLADVLDISTAELIRGECIEQPVQAQEIQEMTDSSLTLFREILQRKRIQNLFIGFLVSAAVMILAFVHLNSPRYIQDPGDALHVERLEGGQLIVVMDEPVTGWDTGVIHDPDTGSTDVFISCYDTALSRMTHRSAPSVHILGNADDTDTVRYYPSPDGDRLLYAKDGSRPDGHSGIVTLPRLIYNMWAALGILLSLAGITAAYLTRRKHFGRTVLKAAALPVIFTASVLAVTAGKADQIYNAQYYFSGILLLSIVLYILFLAVLDRRMSQR